MAERGIKLDHTTIMRWVHKYAHEIEKKIRQDLKLAFKIPNLI